MIPLRPERVIKHTLFWMALAGVFKNELEKLEGCNSGVDFPKLLHISLNSKISGGGVLYSGLNCLKF